MATAGPRACAEACAGAASPAAASVTSATRIDPLLCLEGEGGLLALDLDEHLVHVAGGQLDVVAVMAVGDPAPIPCIAIALTSCDIAMPLMPLVSVSVIAGCAFGTTLPVAREET